MRAFLVRQFSSPLRRRTLLRDFTRQDRVNERDPKAGRSSYRIGFADVMLTLSQGGYDTTVRFTEGRGDATRFAAMHAKEFDTIACIGGDGTLSEVVAGLMQVDNPPPLGYIPLGSTNDVANTLSLPHNAVEAAERIVSGTPIPFDVGGFQDDAYFTYVAAYGAFTEVSYATPQNEKAALSRSSRASTPASTTRAARSRATFSTAAFPTPRASAAP